MASKTIKKPYVEFVGMSANNVTGSAYLIKFKEYQILVDYGLYQSNNLIEDYKINKDRHKSIKPKHIDIIILTHVHADHLSKLPELYKNGCKAPLYVPNGTSNVIKLMLQDSARIMATEAEQLSTKHGIKASPLYTNDDIDIAMSHIIECNFLECVNVNKDVKFTYYNARHIPNSAQILLELNDGVNVKKLMFTGDIGSPTMDKHYLGEFQPIESADVVVGECTYSDNKRKHSIKDRPKDVDKLHTVVSYAIEKKAKVLIPVFSLDRMQMMLTLLYEMYGSNLDIPVIVDSPLSNKINQLWGDMIESDDELWYKVINWQNIRVAHEYNDSKYYQDLDEPMIILSSSGMGNVGRVVGWIKKLLPKSNNYICFCGFATENSTSGKIKAGKDNTISIDGKKVSNKCKVVTLNSFSSHMCYDELMEYYCSINFNKIVLVHSEEKSKFKFAEDLRIRLSQCDRSSKVVCGTNDMKCYF